MSNFRIFLAATVAGGALATGAHAQSTGSIDFEDAIIVTGSRNADVGGVRTPETSKAKVVLTQDIISRQAPGQTVNDIINLVPGVSFQNNDPFGSAGGKLNIRGFDDTRISQTFDGVPLNDSGGYSIYSNQQLDSELIEQVNVNLGTSDVDSPTASATGSTINYRTIVPQDDFGVVVAGAMGDFDFYRMFGVVHTGEFTPFGTKAFFSASRTGNNNVYGVGKIDKQQYNARIYQPIGSNGDFVSIAGHYNENRNNFFGSVPLRLDADRVVGASSSNRFPITKDERFYGTPGCTIDTPQAGVADVPNSCATSFDYRFNPSNTGNIRVQSRFTLADGLILTVDPSYQYVKANGGGTTTGYEYANANGLFGYFGGRPYTGVDLNGDGDLLDAVTILQPSQTQTDRYGVIASLRYDINESHTVRLSYSYDGAHHRQTGEIGRLMPGGVPYDVFPVNDPIVAANGALLEKRDRLSLATLNQFSGEYSGRFMDDRLRVNLGLRAPFFIRNLTNYCFTTSASGFVDCSGQDAATDAAYAAANPDYSPPQSRHFTYNKLLPNVGLVFEVAPAASLFANYSKGLQVPGTDNLYNSFFFPVTTPEARPRPETTDNFDLGVRYTTSRIQGSLSAWYTNYTDRLASAYDVELDRTVYRNLGKVERYGVDGSLAYRPIDPVFLYVWGSYLWSKIKDDVQTGVSSTGTPIYALTAGKRESGAPIYTLGARAQLDLGVVELGGQVKRTGARYVNDQNLPITQTINGQNVFVYGAKAPGYTLVDFDARVNMEWAGLGEKTFLQLNLLNAFDKLYVGGFGGDLSDRTVPNANIGYPRTFMASFQFGF